MGQAAIGPGDRHSAVKPTIGAQLEEVDYAQAATDQVVERGWAQPAVVI